MDPLLAERGDLAQLDVVVIEGSRHGQAFVRSMLSGIKVARIRCYDDAEVALREMRMDPPTLVITDWEMKARSGYWLLTTMRKPEMDPLCFIPALILTSEISWSMLDVALESGVNSVLVKPISAITFRRRLESVVLRPQRFVEYQGYYIPESAKQVLETRMRAHESSDTRAYRMRLRAALERVMLEEEARRLEEQNGATPVPVDQDRGALDWKGWNAA